MNVVSLTNYKIWDDLAKIFAPIDFNSLVQKHLESCNYKINGYWDGKEFYQNITFVNPISVELISHSIGTNLIDNHVSSHWIKLKFLLKPDFSATKNKLVSDDDDEIGELTLILDPNFQIIDENWLLDVASPFLVTKSEVKTPDVTH